MKLHSYQEYLGESFGKKQLYIIESGGSMFLRLSVGLDAKDIRVLRNQQTSKFHRVALCEMSFETINHIMSDEFTESNLRTNLTTQLSWNAHTDKFGLQQFKFGVSRGDPYINIIEMPSKFGFEYGMQYFEPKDFVEYDDNCFVITTIYGSELLETLKKHQIEPISSETKYSSRYGRNRYIYRFSVSTEILMILDKLRYMILVSNSQLYNKYPTPYVHPKLFKV